jgi:RNA polymerase-binding transcription factor DksA
MATKKGASKKAVKAAKPAKKAPEKKPAVQKKAKPAAKKAAEKKPVAKKTGAVKKTEVKHKAPQQKKEVKLAKPAAKHAVPASKKAAPSVKKTPEPAKKVPNKPVEAVKKPAVAAPSQEEVKPAIKPLEKPSVKKEAAKPVVIPKTSTDKAVKYEPDFTKSVLDSSNNQDQSRPTMRYSDVELTEFKELIMKKLETAKKELAYLQGLITRKDGGGDLDEGRYMTMEDGSMSMEREQLSQMASRQIQFIDHLEKALMRIENKTYGICRVTGKLIDKARLRAVPHATLSIEAKQMMNK